jgi:signal transduction histidine kinase/ligand-binding sensor domain-containing protein
MLLHIRHRATAAKAAAAGLRVLCVAACLGSPAAAGPERPAPPAAPWSFAIAAWPTERSLPGDVVALTQDLEGYLWLGTPNGLVRFDGSRFQPWTQPSGTSTLPAGNVSSVAASVKGGVWLGFSGSGGVAYLRDANTVRYQTKEGAPQSVTALIEDRRGNVWVASSHGLFHFDGAGWRKLTAKDGFNAEQAFSVYEDHMGSVWVGSDHGVFRGDSGTFQLVDPITQVESIVEDDAGHIWVTDRTVGLRKLGAPSLPRMHRDIRLPVPGWRLMRDRHGALMLASYSGGLFRLAEPSSPSPLLEPVPFEHRLHGSPRALFEDRDDDIWVGLRGGLMRLSRSGLRPAGPLEGVNHDGVRTTAVGADGSVWVATTHALNRFIGETRKVYPLTQVRVLGRDRSGNMIVVTDDSIGRFIGDRFVEESIPGLNATRVAALTVTPDRLWFCTNFRGVLSWRDGVLASQDQPGEASRQCQSMMADRHGRVWAGFTSDGVVLYEGGTVRQISEADGLSSGAVWQILESRDGSIWFATSEGVSRYQNGRILSATTANLPVGGVSPVLVEDDQGYIWVGVQSGAALLRFNAREMDKLAANRDARLAYTLWDQTDGLQPGTRTWFNGVGGVVDPSGQIWAVNGQGITIVDPRSLREVRPPSIPRIEAVTVNGQRWPLTGNLALPNKATLQIDFAVLNLSSAQKLRFRHALANVDSQWVYDGDEHQARYMDLPAGDYRFRVATTLDGNWTDAGVWAFTVASPFYLSWWFLTGAAAVVIGVAAIGTWMRVRAFQARFAVVAAERARMSREIHDTLLQSLAALGPELETLAVRVGPIDGTTADELRRVRRDVRRSVREARDSILDLRRQATGAVPLEESLDHLANMMASRYGVRPTIAVSGTRPAHVASEVEQQIYQIAREAVMNALRHGQPTNVEVGVAYTGNDVSITVRDNGAGFAPREVVPAAAGEDSHFGLETMRERAEKLGGRLDIASAPGKGTTVHAVAKVTSRWL